MTDRSEITARELLTDEQMLVRIHDHCDTPVAVSLARESDGRREWEVSCYAPPRPDEPDDLSYGGHWLLMVGDSLHDVVVRAYRYLFPDLVEPS